MSGAGRAAGDSSVTDGDDVKNSAFVRAALEATVTQLKARVRELTDDVEQLRSTRGKISSETQEFVAYATAELKAKDDIISELRTRISDIEFARDAEIRRLQQQMEAALEVSTSEQRVVERDLREKLHQAEARLEKSLQFLERREEMETRIEVLQATLEAERAASKKAFQDLERKYLLEKAVLLKEHQAQYSEMRRAARMEAQKSLESDTQRVVLENKQMSEELALQADESKHLAKERLAVMEQARVLAREVEIYADKEREWARQGAIKTQENRALQARSKELETALSMERADKEMTRQHLTKQHAKQVRGSASNHSDSALRWMLCSATEALLCLSGVVGTLPGSHVAPLPLFFLACCRTRSCVWSWTACGRWCA